MRVLALIHEAFGPVGGIARFNSDLLTALTSYPSCSEVVVLPRNPNLPTEALPPKLRYITRGGRGKLAYLAGVMRLLTSGVRFDLILCGHINLLPFAEICRVRMGGPLLLLIYGVDAWCPTGRRLVDRVARRVDCFAGISSFTNSRFLHWAGLEPEKAFLLPGCVDLRRYLPGARNPALVARYGLEGRKVLMTLARLDRRERSKGVDEVLEALPELVVEIPDILYLVVGGGTDRLRLEAKARSLGCGGHTVFTGQVAEEEKVDHYRLANVFILAGRAEGFGIVLLEAMACGVPVVASKLDGSREALRDGALGTLVDPRDRGDLSAGIRTALRQPTGPPTESLSFFSRDNFEARLHHMLDRVFLAPVKESFGHAPRWG